ncbi:MAG: E3 binding domain-containing protein [Caldilineaceae bacterium]
MAEGKGVDVAPIGGTGPGGRIIEQDVQAALAAQPS